MLSYIIRRVLLFIPTLFLVSCLAFVLKENVPSDPVETLLTLQGIDDSKPNYQDAYEQKYTELGLDIPNFYLTIASNHGVWLSSFDTDYPTKLFAEALAHQRYEEEDIRRVIEYIGGFTDKQKRQILTAQSLDDIRQKLTSVRLSSLEPEQRAGLSRLIDEVESNTYGWHYPVIRFHGTDNQYHLWVTSFLQGDFGVSLMDARPVFDKIWGSLRWTLLLIVLTLLLSVSISFAFGVYNGMNEGSRFDRYSGTVFFIFYSIPKFWLATVMIIFFTTSEHGAWTNIFPVVGMWSSDAFDFGGIIIHSFDKLLLPCLVIIIPDVAYLSRVIRAGIIDEREKEYIKTARSKGASMRSVIWSHIIPNSLTPTITLMAGVIPSALGASLIIEVLFNIPGMGRLMYTSILNADWNVVFPIVLLVGVITMVCFLLADVLVAILNPKVKVE